MTKKLITAVCLLLNPLFSPLLSPIFSPLACAQNITRTLERVTDKGAYLELVTNDGRYVIQPYSDSIVETTFIPKGEVFNPTSHAVVLRPAALPTRLKTSATGMEYVTSGLVVSINTSPFQISYSYKGKPLISEKNGYMKKDGADIIDFNLDTTEALYGAGARALGMNRRGHRLPLYNKAHYGYEERSSQMNFALPLMFSSKMYGIHFDNAPIGFLDFDSKKENVLAYETISGRKTYQVIAGDSWEDIVGNYTSLTGRQPLPPRWAFGNFSSRFGYHSEAEARAIVDKFAAEQIPLDAIIFDLYWFGKEIKDTMGNLEFDQDNFPHPAQMIADFAKKGVKTILITEPFILTSSGKWQEAVQKNILATDKAGAPFVYDFYFGNTGLIDIFNPAAKEWFWNVYKNLHKQGVAGWWGDLGEPEVHPSALQHHTGSADELHNIYGHQWAKLIAEGYQKDFPQQRPFILMRAGYSGSQRFGMIPWSGDVNRSWGGLAPQPEIALQMGMQGLAYMHSDLGGFAGANLDDELYTRWLQYGVFQPIFRPHAQEEVAAEPVLREQKTKELAKAAIQLRYRLLPYNYTLAFDNNQQGLPLMRPLFYDEPHNARLFGVSDTYLWGHDFLVSPVLKAGVKEMAVYFPVANNWFDFYSGKQYQGGSTQTVAVVADHIPLFVRGGAFIPMSKPLQSTQNYATKAFDLHYYDDATVSRSSGKLYEDNGATAQAFEKGCSTLLYFDSVRKGQDLFIGMQAKNGAHYQAIDRSVSLFIHHLDRRPKQVWLGKQALAFSWDDKTHVLSALVPWNKTAPVKLLVKLTE
ncbi:glycoside hydrolase family 31 protein [soil metagenome]